MYNKDRRISEQGKEIEIIKTRMQEKLASEKDRLRRLVVCATFLSYYSKCDETS